MMESEVGWVLINRPRIPDDEPDELTEEDSLLTTSQQGLYTEEQFEEAKEALAYHHAVGNTHIELVELTIDVLEDVLE